MIVACGGPSAFTYMYTFMLLMPSSLLLPAYACFYAFWHCHPYILQQNVFTLVKLVFHCQMYEEVLTHEPHPFCFFGSHMKLHVHNCLYGNTNIPSFTSAVNVLQTFCWS